MTTQRERFEAWAKSNGVRLPIEKGSLGYIDARTIFAYAAWQEAERQMIEQCEWVCDELEEHYSGFKDTALLNGGIALSNAASGEPRACRAIKAAIRALGADDAAK